MSGVVCPHCGFVRWNGGRRCPRCGTESGPATESRAVRRVGETQPVVRGPWVDVSWKDITPPRRRRLSDGTRKRVREASITGGLFVAFLVLYLYATSPSWFRFGPPPPDVLLPAGTTWPQEVAGNGLSTWGISVASAGTLQGQYHSTNASVEACLTLTWPTNGSLSALPANCPSDAAYSSGWGTDAAFAVAVGAGTIYLTFFPAVGSGGAPPPSTSVVWTSPLEVTHG